MPLPLLLVLELEMLNGREIRDISSFLERWKPTHSIVVNLRPGIDASPKRLDQLMRATLHRIERWSYGRRTHQVEAVAWAERGKKRDRLHLHIIARLPPPLRKPLDADSLATAWWSSARSIAAADTYFAPLTDPLASWIYSQKGGGEMMTYTKPR